MLVSVVVLAGGVYIGASASAYVANIAHSRSAVDSTKTVATKPKTTASSPAPTTVVTTKKTTPAPTPVASSTPTTTTVTVPAPIQTAPTTTTTTASDPSTDVTSLTPAPTTTPASTTSTNTPTTTTTTAPSTTSYTSTNWSGYMVPSGTFTAISGAWTVPNPSGNGTSTTSDAAWIGIGGVSASDLIQVGTDDTVSSSGIVTTTAFYELLPATARQIVGMTVQPGDSMQASLAQSGGQWTITISDLTKGQTYTKVTTYSSSLSSAEWIEEEPFYANGTQVPLDTFGSVTFTSSLATNNGISLNLASLGASKITMVNQSGTPIVVPSVIGSDNASFTATQQ